MGQYDISSKVLFQDYERDFVALTLGTDDFVIVGQIPTEFPSVQMRMTDAPMRVRLGDGTEVIVHIEFQTETSQDPMEFRIAEYIGRLLHEYRLPVYVTVIYLSSSAGADDPGGYVYNRDDIFAYALHYQVIRVAEIDGQTILDQKSPIGLIPLTPLMKRPEDVSPEDWLNRCIQTVLEIPLESEKKRDYVACFCVLSNLVYESDLVVKLVEEVQTVIDFEKIPIIQMFMDKARTEAQAEAAARIAQAEADRAQAEADRAQTEAEARAAKAQAEARAAEAEARADRAQAEAEARAAIEAEAAQERRNAYADALMKIVERQYGERGFEEFGAHIRSIEDDGKLAALIESALDLTSMDRFREVLNAS
jgi:hypothetical protein